MAALTNLRIFARLQARFVDSYDSMYGRKHTFISEMDVHGVERTGDREHI